MYVIISQHFVFHLRDWLFPPVSWRNNIYSEASKYSFDPHLLRHEHDRTEHLLCSKECGKRGKSYELAHDVNLTSEAENNCGICSFKLDFSVLESLHPH